MPAVLGGLGGGSFCSGQLSTLSLSTSQDGLEERVQERGMPNHSEGNVKTGENVTLRNN